MHSHVGPAFAGAPADNLNNNMIIGNRISGNLADIDDTATPGRVGININSGKGGTPIWGTIISQNKIWDEDFDVTVNTPGTVNIHLNDLLGGKVGMANICSFDNAPCTGHIDATQNYWGCPSGPGHAGCSSVSGNEIRVTPSLYKTAAESDEKDD